MKKILIVEDDAVLRTELLTLLTSSGYEAHAVRDFQHTLEQMREAHASLILLDINLPGISGENLLREFRAGDATPVIMLTSRTGDLDELLSMSYGADDYVTKPFNPAILLLRISAVLKRTEGKPNASSYRDVSVNLLSGSISRAGQEEILTKNEAIIFSVLLDHVGEIVSRDELMTALWDNEEYINDNALTVSVSRLRSKLARVGQAEAIETRKKQGYLLR